MAGPGGLRCAGLVEFYRGSLGGTIGLESHERLEEPLGNVICAALQCGSFLKLLTETEAARALGPGEGRPLPVQWKIQNPWCVTLEECFRKVQPQAGGQVLGLVCSGEWNRVEPRGGWGRRGAPPEGHCRFLKSLHTAQDTSDLENTGEVGRGC